MKAKGSRVRSRPVRARSTDTRQPTKAKSTQHKKYGMLSEKANKMLEMMEDGEQYSDDVMHLRCNQ